MIMSNMYFVWTNGLRGPTAELWDGIPINGNGKPVVTPIYQVKLTEGEKTMSLDYLAMKYERFKYEQRR